MSTRLSKRQRELEAAALVAAELDGIAVARDGRKAPPGTHDFDIVTGDRTVALEVTTSVDELALRAIARMSNALTEAPELAEVWVLIAEHPKDEATMPDFKRIGREAGALLAQLEAEGCREVGRTHSPIYRLSGEPRRIAEKLLALGVTSAAAVGPPSEGEGWFSVSLVGGGGWHDPEALNEAVVKECAANVKKVVAAGRDDGQVFIWMDTSNFASEFALFMGRPPQSGPDLPEGISIVWIGMWDPGKTPGSKSSLLWKATRDGWEILAVPDVGTLSRRLRRRAGS